MMKLFYKILIISVLYFLRIYLLSSVGLYDFDSVKNYLVIQEINQGNFENLFHHASPLFYLIFAVFAQINSHYLFLEFINAGINLFSLFIFINFLKKETQLTDYQEIILFIFIGTSLFLVNSARYFSIEVLSGLLFNGVLILYYKSLNSPPVKGNQEEVKYYKYLNISALLFGLFYTVNYKAILFLPIFLLIEIFQNRRKIAFKNWIFAGLIAFLPILFCILLGYWQNIPIWKYPAVIYQTIATPRGGQAEFDQVFTLDFFYYFEYLFHFENPFLLIGISWFSITYRENIFLKFRYTNLEAYLFWLTLAYFLGMSLVLKAPRGLSFIYPILYGLALLPILKLEINKPLKYALSLAISLSIFLQVYRLQIYIYQYADTQYDTIAEYLHQHKIKKIVSTVSLNLIPFAQKYGIEVKTIFDEKEIPELQKQGFEYVLLDDFYLITSLLNFKQLEKIKPLQSWHEPTLIPPMIYFEHSEFTRLNFHDTWVNWQKAKQQKSHIRLLKLLKND